MRRKIKLIAYIAFFAVITFAAGNVYTSYCRDIAVYNEQIDDLDRQLDIQKKQSKLSSLVFLEVVIKWLF